jgi:hypothetical protein
MAIGEGRDGSQPAAMDKISGCAIFPVIGIINRRALARRNLRRLWCELP